MIDGYPSSPLISAGNNWCFVHVHAMLSDRCPEEDILENPTGLTDLFDAYVQNGANLLLAPTFNLNRFYLESYHATDDMEALNREMMYLTHKSSRGIVPLGAVISQYPVSLAPLDDSVSFEDLVSFYKEQVSCLLLDITDLFLLDSFSDIRHARAAVLAVKESCNLPVYVTFAVNSQNSYFETNDILSALVTLQSMGISMFGICGRSDLSSMETILKSLSEYAKIPLIAMPDGIYEDETGVRHLLSPEEFSQAAQKLISSSVRFFGISDRLSSDFVSSLKESFRFADIPDFHGAEDDINTVLASSFRDIGFVNITSDISADIACSAHLYEDIIHTENQTGAILKIVIENEDDLAFFESNSYAFKNPVCVKADNLFLLEMSARVFCGRLICDRSYDFTQESLEPLKQKYGLILL